MLNNESDIIFDFEVKKCWKILCKYGKKCYVESENLGGVKHIVVGT